MFVGAREETESLRAAGQERVRPAREQTPCGCLVSALCLASMDEPTTAKKLGGYIANFLRWIKVSHQDPITQPVRSPSPSVSEPLGQDILVVAGTGIKILLKKVEGCLDGTLARAPVAAVNAIIAIKDAVKDNRGAIEKLIIQTAERLLAVDEAVGQGIPDSAKPRMKAFAGILREGIGRLEKMASKGTFRRVLENEADKGAIEDIFKEIDQATKTFQLDIAWFIERRPTTLTWGLGRP
ncbi:hypothetical protein F5887DRAFT_279974 [Amanita rubescens]|nr:hypothetical protein F5887DRAFT_279974 [Amanita rubescens]